MDNEAKERLWNVAKKLVEVSYTNACDHTSTDEEFQKTVDALVSHLMKVRRRSQVLYLEKETA